MIICPKCRALAVFNIHFGAYICTNNGCDWKDDTFHENRIKKYKLLISRSIRRKEETELSATEQI